MLKTIHTFGDPILRKKARRIEVIDQQINTLVNDMFETMYAAEGIGLAAPQVGESIRLFIIDINPMDSNEGKRVFINPEILEFGDEKDVYEEGCLSIPTVHEDVLRPTGIRIKYQSLDGEEHDEWIDTFLARVIQHEFDHLEGVLFTDRLSALKRSLLKNTLKKIANGEIEVELSENYQL
ncbi:MAG: peptide deformylase [Candidatus Marinimicrobia bacterium]|nr:peptide deformylase [Candidatus Neomarinimicrobiota bacterium]MCF7840140.1 peptide deformylase [Candidatus Neomarinimicrobiota bacterium]